MKRLIFAAIGFLIACDAQYIEFRQVVPEEKREAQQKWILDCVEKANPKSDEEPEDWIRMCAFESRKLFGTRTRGALMENGCHGRMHWEPSEAAVIGPFPSVTCDPGKACPEQDITCCPYDERGR